MECVCDTSSNKSAALAATRSPVISLFWCLIKFTTTCCEAHLHFSIPIFLLTLMTASSLVPQISAISFDDIGWIQATLHIRLGGIGLRRASDLALSAYLASISASQPLISEITQPDSIPHALDSCFDVWSSTNPSLPENPNLQRQWDDIKSSSRSVALRPLLDQH